MGICILFRFVTSSTKSKMRLIPLLKIYPFIVILFVMSVYTTADKYLLVEIEDGTGVDPLPEGNPTEELPTYEDEGPATAPEEFQRQNSDIRPGRFQGGKGGDIRPGRFQGGKGGDIRPGRFHGGKGGDIRPGRRSGFRYGSWSQKNRRQDNDVNHHHYYRHGGPGKKGYRARGKGWWTTKPTWAPSTTTTIPPPPPPIDCEMGEWTEFGDCVCERGTQCLYPDGSPNLPHDSDEVCERIRNKPVAKHGGYGGRDDCKSMEDTQPCTDECRM